ncbi:MAG: hypothetical protein MR487_06135 [Lachnospiraceae bacterium]|nr:hypothetical protein [Lachnospiraceae bacterium]
MKVKDSAKKILKALFVSFVVSAFVLIIIYIILPKKSWIKLSSSPYEFVFNKVDSVEYLVKGSLFTFDDSYKDTFNISSPISISVYLSDKDDTVVFYENISDVQLYIDCDEDAMPIEMWPTDCLVWKFSNDVDWGVFNLNFFNYPSNFSADFSLTSTGRWYDADNNLHRSSEFTVEGAIPVSSRGEFYESIYEDPENHNNASSYAEFSIPSDTSLNLYGCYSIGINDDFIDSAYRTEIVFHDGELFNTFFNMAIVTIDDLDDSSISLVGHGEKIAQTSSGADDVLTFTYQNNQSEYIIDSVFVEAEAANDSVLDIEYSLIDGNSTLNSSGRTKLVRVADVPLSFNIGRFLIDNVGAIIIGVFTTFLGVYINIYTKND